MITLSDIFIGDFPYNQCFGGNPDMYAKFGLNGHNGVDWGIPNGIQLVSPFNGEISEVGSDPSGYGLYCKIRNMDMLCYVIYGHQKQIVVTQGQKVVKGQLVGYSDNTGNSTGPHLHLGVYRIDANGNKINGDNGYGGAVNPMDGRSVTWDIKNITQPVTQDIEETFLCPKKTFEELVDKCNKYDTLQKEHLELLATKGTMEGERNQCFTDLSNLDKSTKQQIDGLTKQLKDESDNSKNLKKELDLLREKLNSSGDVNLEVIATQETTIKGLEIRVTNLQAELNTRPRFKKIWKLGSIYLGILE